MSQNTNDFHHITEDTVKTLNVSYVSEEYFTTYICNCSRNRTSHGEAELVNETHHTTTRVTSGVFYILVFMTGTIINSYIILCVVLCSELRRKFSNVLLLHLCVANLVLCLLMAPINGILALKPSWRLPHTACMVLGSISATFILVSMCTVLVINIDKYKTIVCPLSYSTYTTTRRVVLFVLSVWSFTLATLITIHTLGPNFNYSQNKGGCTLDFSVSQRINIAALILLSATFLLPTLIMTIFYIRIFQIARSHRKRIVNLFHKVAIQVQAPLTSAHIRRPSSFVEVYAMIGDTKAFCTISIIIGSFVVCYLPFGIVSLYEATVHKPVHPSLMLVASVLFRSCPVINALVYGGHNKILRGDTVVYQFRALRNKLQHSSKITFQEGGSRHREGPTSRPVFVIADSGDEADT